MFSQIFRCKKVEMFVSRRNKNNAHAQPSCLQRIRRALESDHLIKCPLFYFILFLVMEGGLQKIPYGNERTNSIQSVNQSSSSMQPRESSTLGYNLPIAFSIRYYNFYLTFLSISFCKETLLLFYDLLC